MDARVSRAQDALERPLRKEAAPGFLPPAALTRRCGASLQVVEPVFAALGASLFVAWVAFVPERTGIESFLLYHFARAQFDASDLGKLFRFKAAFKLDAVADGDGHR